MTPLSQAGNNFSYQKQGQSQPSTSDSAPTTPTGATLVGGGSVGEVGTRGKTKVRTTTTVTEREAFVWMQGRMVDLLMRHDSNRFGELFGERSTAEPTSVSQQILKRYRDLAVLFYLRDELFENILPNIKRRLSFEAPRQTQVEELPARGRVDWAKTARQSLRERPTEVALEVITRQHRRHFATPENLLTVITLLEYRNAVQTLLDYETNLDLEQVLSHPLNDIVDKCTRELAFLQFASLVFKCEEILEGYGSNQTATTEELEQQVAANLVPGHNSAYSDLLEWREKLWGLRLLDRLQAQKSLQPMLGVDPDRDNYLYQLWLFYEMGEMLSRRGQLLKWDYTKMQLSYWWGGNGSTEDEPRVVVEYKLQHDQSISNIPDYWNEVGQTRPNAPGVRPDFYIERMGRQQVLGVEHVDKTGKKIAPNIIWHEPGFILDAKYYKPRENASAKAPSNPVKRMLADLQLTGERFGALLFAFQNTPKTSLNSSFSADYNSGEQTTRNDNYNEIVVSEGSLVEENNVISASNDTGTDSNNIDLEEQEGVLYSLKPTYASAQYIQPDLEVAIWRFRPELALETTESKFEQQLVKLFESIHQKLRGQVEEITCRGVFLDSLTTNAHGQLAELAHLVRSQRYEEITTKANTDNTDKLENLLLCPKPHIAPWRVDIVSAERDCCKNPILCHIAGLTPKPQIPLRLATLQDIEKAIKQNAATASNNAKNSTDTTMDDELVRVATIRIKEVTQRYADLIKPNMEDFRDDIRRRVGTNLFTTTQLLTEAQRETLALGCFLQKQIEGIKAANFAGPALLFTGILEELVRYTLYERSSLKHSVKAQEKTLGGILTTTNTYQIRLAMIRNNLWQEKISAKLTYTFDDWLEDLKVVKEHRNTSAHHAFLKREDFEDLIDRFFSSPNYGPGVFDGLLRAWRG
jgi:hypothetical protein